MIGLTAASYPCVGFEIPDANPPPPTARFAIIRHDVDMSLLQALALAWIEADLGIRATYHLVVERILQPV
jgi:hypothetical protein